MEDLCLGCRDIASYSSDDRLQMYLSWQLIPFMIFIALNLPEDTIPTVAETWTKKRIAKYAQIAFAMYNYCFHPNSPTEVNMEPSYELFRSNFILTAIEDPLRRSLTGRDSGTKKYNKAYSLSNNNNHYSDFDWLLHFFPSGDPMEHLYGLKVFLSILNSCTISINDTIFQPNMAVNLYAFNALTGYVDLLHGHYARSFLASYFPCPSMISNILEQIDFNFSLEETCTLFNLTSATRECMFNRINELNLADEFSSYCKNIPDLLAYGCYPNKTLTEPQIDLGDPPCEIYPSFEDEGVPI